MFWEYPAGPPTWYGTGGGNYVYSQVDPEYPITYVWPPQYYLTSNPDLPTVNHWPQRFLLFDGPGLPAYIRYLGWKP